WAIHGGEEGCGGARQDRLIDRLREESRFITIRALNESEQFNFSDLHTAGVGSANGGDCPAVMLIRFGIREESCLSLETGGEIREGDSGDRFPGAAVESGDGVVVRTFQE